MHTDPSLIDAQGFGLQPCTVLAAIAGVVVGLLVFGLAVIVVVGAVIGAGSS
jgi:hypothetical protein